MIIQCELPEYNPPSERIIDILKTYKTVAVVGLSPKAERDSHKVAKYLKDNGFTIIPVNPGQKEILGEKSYPNLKSIPSSVDIVNIFRRPDAVLSIVEDAVEIGAKAVWMQLGIANNKAAQKAREAGIEVVMSKCIKIEHINMIEKHHYRRKTTCRS
ncbi:MAG: CoA-binding protein [Deltaproteobacteria bacterium]|nr:CoA-binding protein [Deltaproteobacteria bacterium]MBW2319207.1 CoA-binding protein [Deltaproteobacteria bacterium]MBW2602352.1 CoA-binding protein [Deltaproteobacteria bacterium]